VKASAEKRELILKIYKYFGAESKRKPPFYAWNKVIDRTNLKQENHEKMFI
jgi:hypothetical protein